MFKKVLFGLCFVCLSGAMSLTGQIISKPSPPVLNGMPQGRNSPLASNVVIPQVSRVFNTASGEYSPVEISEVQADIGLIEQIAATTLTITLKNISSTPQQTELVVPVPDGAVVRSLSIEPAEKNTSSTAEPPKTLTGKVLPLEEAKSLYTAIVNKMKDPALVEFAGYNLIRSNVFPVPANGSVKLKLVFENVLKAEGNRVDYILPRSERIDAAEIPWKLKAVIQSRRTIVTVYSPSHYLTTEQPEPGVVVAQTIGDGKGAPGPFRLSYLLEGEGLSATSLAYPNPNGQGGYFMLLGGIPITAKSKAHEHAPALTKEITFVLDRSGSMAGQKIEQAKAAALQVLESIPMGEPFNIVDFSDRVAQFSSKPVEKTEETVHLARQYISRIQSSGGTNIDGALQTALKQPVSEKISLPVVLFLTDGCPTSGVTSEVEIRQNALTSNQAKRRIFTFGVGYDVNSPLLDGLASDSRAATTFVQPNEDVEVKVSQLLKRLGSPLMADPKLEVFSVRGDIMSQSVREIFPAKLNDIYENDQLVLIGKYQTSGPLVFRVSGNYLGAPEAFIFNFGFDRASRQNSFIPRLWASRKIASLVQDITKAGANPATAAKDPRLKELTDEIVRLSMEFGILTEYTAFLATETTDLTRREEVLNRVQNELVHNAQQTRTGVGGMTQVANNVSQRTQSTLNYSNAYVTQQNERTQIQNVRQVHDQTLFRRSNGWVDARLLNIKTLKADQVIEFGTPEYFGLVEKLSREGRQGLLADPNDVFLSVEGKVVQVKMPGQKGK
ncbi:MAG: VWA domain-containing protein [Acidobacteria bacterium]|nr:VWA domain-containing protein [Acidobacteriota bacterium]